MEEQVLKTTLRNASFNDIYVIKNIFKDTIIHINSKDYTPEQISAWVKRGEDDAVWRSRIIKQHFIVAEIDSDIIGFASLTTDGHIDLLFVDYNHQHKGIATSLLEYIEEEAFESSFDKITADVSITAKPFFQSKGYRVIKEQQVDIGVILTNYKMIKYIA